MAHILKYILEREKENEGTIAFHKNWRDLLRSYTMSIYVTDLLLISKNLSLGPINYRKNLHLQWDLVVYRQPGNVCVCRMGVGVNEGGARENQIR